MSEELLPLWLPKEAGSDGGSSSNASFQSLPDDATPQEPYRDNPDEFFTGFDDTEHETNGSSREMYLDDPFGSFNIEPNTRAIHDDDVGLLDSVVHRIHSAGIEAPSFMRMTQGDVVVEDLDAFYRELYEYHYEGGWLQLVVNRCGQVVRTLFTVLFSALVLFCLDVEGMITRCRGVNTCGALADYISGGGVAGATYVLLGFGLVAWDTLTLGVQVFPYLRRTQYIYKNKLNIVSSAALRRLDWPQVVDRLRLAHRSGRFRLELLRAAPPTEEDVATRVRRLNDYVDAAVKYGFFSVKVLPAWCDRLVPGMSRTGWSPAYRWCATATYFANVLDTTTFRLSRVVTDDRDRTIEDRTTNMSFFAFLMVPVFVVRTLVQFAFELAEQVSTAASKVQALGAGSGTDWTDEALALLRRPRELDHAFRARRTRLTKSAHAHAWALTNPIRTSLFETLSFVLGAVVASLLVLTVVDESALMHLTVVGSTNLLTTLTASTVLLAVCRTYLPPTEPPTDNAAAVAASEILLEVGEDQFRTGFLGAWARLVRNLVDDCFGWYAIGVVLRNRAPEFRKFVRENTRGDPLLGDVYDPNAGLEGLI